MTSSPRSRAMRTASGLSAPGCIHTNLAPASAASATIRSVTDGGVMIDTPRGFSGSDLR